MKMTMIVIIVIISRRLDQRDLSGSLRGLRIEINFIESYLK